MRKTTVGSYTRRLPSKHTVKSHIRAGHRVRQYVKGTGTAPKISKITGRPIKRIPHKTMSIDLGLAKNWNIKFIYEKGDLLNAEDFEEVSVFSDNYIGAEKLAWKLRKYQHRTPVKVIVDDPDLLGAINKIRKSDVAQRFHNEMLRGASKNLQSKGFLGKVIGDKLGEKVSEKDFERLSARAKTLLDQAFSDDRSVRTLARARLKREFREIYDNADFSTGSAEQEHQRSLEKAKFADTLKKSGEADANAKFRQNQIRINELRKKATGITDKATRDKMSAEIAELLKENEKLT